MRRSPSIVPAEHDQDVYLVLDDFGHLGRAWRETDESNDRATVVQDLLDGQYRNPVRVISFNTAEGTSRDVSEDIADGRSSDLLVMARLRAIRTETDLLDLVPEQVLAPQPTCREAAP